MTGARFPNPSAPEAGEWTWYCQECRAKGQVEARDMVPIPCPICGCVLVESEQVGDSFDEDWEPDGEEPAAGAPPPEGQAP